MNRRSFIIGNSLALIGFCLPFSAKSSDVKKDPTLSDFEKRLQPVGRALEFEDYYVWCNSPIEGPDGKIHVFFSRWPKEKKMSGWINSSEIAHAVADKPEEPYTYMSTILTPRGEGFWDAHQLSQSQHSFCRREICPFLHGKFKRKNEHQTHRISHCRFTLWTLGKTRQSPAPSRRKRQLG